MSRSESYLDNVPMKLSKKFEPFDFPLEYDLLPELKNHDELMQSFTYEFNSELVSLEIANRRCREICDEAEKVRQQQLIQQQKLQEDDEKRRLKQQQDEEHQRRQQQSLPVSEPIQHVFPPPNFDVLRRFPSQPALSTIVNDDQVSTQVTSTGTSSSPSSPRATHVPLSVRTSWQPQHPIQTPLYDPLKNYHGHETTQQAYSMSHSLPPYSFLPPASLPSQGQSSFQNQLPGYNQASFVSSRTSSTVMSQTNTNAPVVNGYSEIAHPASSANQMNHNHSLESSSSGSLSSPNNSSGSSVPVSTELSVMPVTTVSTSSGPPSLSPSSSSSSSIQPIVSSFKRVSMNDFEVVGSSPFDDALLTSIDERKELNSIFETAYPATSMATPSSVPNNSYSNYNNFHSHHHQPTAHYQPFGHPGHAFSANHHLAQAHVFPPTSQPTGQSFSNQQQPRRAPPSYPPVYSNRTS